MISWPVAVVICVIVFCVYGVLDTWLKQPRFEKRVGNLRVVMRGEEAKVAMQHFNSMTALGFGEAFDEAAKPQPPKPMRGKRFSTSGKKS